MRQISCRRAIGLGLGLGLCLTVLGCSAPTTTSSTATASPTSAASPTAQPQATPSPTLVPQAAPAATATSQVTAAAQGVRLVIDTGSSQASYHAHEQLVGRTLPSEAVGTTKSVSGTLMLGADGSPVADQSKITADLTALKSDESRRDNFIKNNTLETRRFPNAEFVPKQVQGLPWPLPASGQATFELLGDLTVHGVTKPVTWQVSTTFDGDSVAGQATTNVQITDFGMDPPKAGPVLSIENGLDLELAFSAAVQSAM